MAGKPSQVRIDAVRTGWKACYDCGKDQPLENFHLRKDTFDKRDGRCKDCAREALRRSRAAHPERDRPNRQRAYKNQMSNPETAEKKRARERAYYAKHREKRREHSRRMYAQNKAAYKDRARQRQMEAPPLDREYAAILERDPCSYCGGPGGTIDHIVPISSGGDGEASNLTAACDLCNKSKQANSLLRFLLRRCVDRTG